jgi:hypothetical protein
MRERSEEELGENAKIDFRISEMDVFFENVLARFTDNLRAWPLQPLAAGILRISSRDL